MTSQQAPPLATIDDPASYPSPASSAAESILPTPEQPYHSRQSSLHSTPSVESSPPLPSISPPIITKTPPLYASEDMSRASTIVPSVPAPSHPSRPPSMSIRHPHSPHRSPRSQRRSATHPNPRAPPPPPILLRRPTDAAHPGRYQEDVPLATGSSSGSSNSKSPTRSTFGGLNIAGVELREGGIGEESDSLSELLKTPARTNFFSKDQNGAGAPVSPAWQSFDKTSPHLQGSPAGRGHRAKGSMDLPFSPLGSARQNSVGTRGAFEPTPEHGIHARNLSLYFPQPGQRPATEERVVSPFSTSPENFESIPQFAGEQPGAGKERKVFGGTGDWSFGHSHASLGPGAAEGSKRSKRRGHHHKHSLSHNFFSFLDPTQTEASLSASTASTASTSAPTPRRADTPQKVPMQSLLSAPLISSASSPSLSPLPPPKDSSHQQMLMSFGILEFLIGAGLWVEGQMSGWRCLAGLGYLVVFDAMGVGISVIAGKGDHWSNIRRPYGSARFLSLMYFAQSIFLVFAAVYIAKEALEQVVLGSGAHEHAVGGAHSHGEPVIDGDERPFPHFLLISALLASTFSGGALDNHSKLVEAVGPLFLPLRFTTSRLAKRYPALLVNPFSLTIAATAAAVLGGSLFLPSTSYHALDSSLSLLLTILTVALSYPSTLAFGHVLLQTAPPASSSQMKSLRRSIKDISSDNRVLGVGTLRCWSIGATTPLPDYTPSTPTFGLYSGTNSPAPSVPSSPRTPFSPSTNDSPTRPPFSTSSSIHPSLYPSRHDASKEGPDTPLVVSLIVHVHPDTSDKDVLEVTKTVWTKLSSAVNSGSRGKRMGIMGGGAEGEVTVSIKRGWDGVGE